MLIPIITQLMKPPTKITGIILAIFKFLKSKIAVSIEPNKNANAAVIKIHVTDIAITIKTCAKTDFFCMKDPPFNLC